MVSVETQDELREQVERALNASGYPACEVIAEQRRFFGLRFGATETRPGWILQRDGSGRLLLFHHSEAHHRSQAHQLQRYQRALWIAGVVASEPQVPPSKEEPPYLVVAEDAGRYEAAPWLKPVISPDHNKALSISLLVHLPNLPLGGIFVWAQSDGWYGKAEWELGGWEEGEALGPFMSPTSAEVAARQDLHRVAFGEQG